MILTAEKSMETAFFINKNGVLDSAVSIC